MELPRIFSAFGLLLLMEFGDKTQLAVLSVSARTGRPFAVFAYYFLWKRGFAAGYRGLLVSAVSASFDFWAHAKLWEMEALGLDASPK